MKMMLAAAVVVASAAVTLAEPEVKIILIGGKAKYTVPSDKVLLIENVYHAKTMEVRKQAGRIDSIYFEIEPSFWAGSNEDENRCRFPLKIPSGWTLSTVSKPKPMYLFAVLLKRSELSAYLSRSAK